MLCEFKRLVWRQYGLLLSATGTYPFNLKATHQLFFLYHFQLTSKIASLHEKHCVAALAEIFHRLDGSLCL